MERHQARKLLRLRLNLEFSSIRVTKLMVARESQLGTLPRLAEEISVAGRSGKTVAKHLVSLLWTGIHEFSSSTLK